MFRQRRPAITARLMLFIVVLGTLACDSQAQVPPKDSLDVVGATSLFEQHPTARLNPIERCPLVAVIDFEAPANLSVEVTTTDGRSTWSQPYSSATLKRNSAPAQTATDGTSVADANSPILRYSLPVMGLRPNRLHAIRVTLTDRTSGQQEKSEAVTIQTAPLPRDFPPLRVLRYAPKRMGPAITFFSVNLWRESKTILDYGYMVAVNERGEVVWYCKTQDRTADMRVNKAGHIIYQQGSYRYAYEIDLMGRDHRRWVATNITFLPDEESIPVDADTLHHDLVEMQNGNMMSLSTELRRFEQYPTSEFNPNAPWIPTYVVCDRVLEFEPDTGKVVDHLHLKDILDPDRFGYMALSSFWRDKYKAFTNDESPRDWSHANSVTHIPDENAILVSFRHLDCVIKIDWNTKKIRWILGNHKGWSKPWHKYLLEPVGDLDWAYHQHAPQLTPRGTVMMYDNGNYRASPFDKATMAPNNRSRVVEYAIDEDEMTVRQVFVYDGDAEDRFYCPFYGEAEWLPQTGHILVTDGGHVELKDGTPHDNVPGERQWARIFELDPSTGERIFEIACRSPLGNPFGWSIYRSMRRENLWDGFDLVCPEKEETGVVFPRERHIKRSKMLNPLFTLPN
ncbi:MAG: aryl-sulfate sulfotransferase [Pirellulaceae bacterium]